MTEEVKQYWEATAAYFQNEIDMPVGVDWTGPWAPDVSLFDDVQGAEVLELGYGGGQCTVALAERGADITGIDLSTEQLAHARDLAADHGVDPTFVQGDVTDLAVDDESFDVAFNAWVFQWVGDLGACFEETYRVLRPGGRFVFSMPHPYYDIVDPETGEMTESYFDTGRQTREAEGIAVDQVTYRHSVSGVHSALVDAGFTVTELREPGVDDPAAYDEGPWGEYRPSLTSKLPSVLVVDAEKPPVRERSN